MEPLCTSVWLCVTCGLFMCRGGTKSLSISTNKHNKEQVRFKEALEMQMKHFSRTMIYSAVWSSSGKQFFLPSDGIQEKSTGKMAEKWLKNMVMFRLNGSTSGPSPIHEFPPSKGLFQGAGGGGTPSAGASACIGTHPFAFAFFLCGS